MQLYMAPMEGLTGYVYRNAYQKYYGGIDKYFTPFIAIRRLNLSEINYILPVHYHNMQVVPQIYTNQADVFLGFAGELREYGYGTVNLNLGCPSGTVVAKKRGAGFLALPEELDRFLEEIFAACPLKISIKTRIGVESPAEWEHLLSIYEKYPMEELIVHPRIQKDYYNNTPNLAALKKAVEDSRQSLCYNGDIRTVADYQKITKQFPTVGKVMLGRGILGNPGLVGEIRAVLPGEDAAASARLNKETLLAFHDDILHGYQSAMSGDRNTLFKMKELWFYLAGIFTGPEKYIKKIKKAQRIAEYETVVAALFREQELVCCTDDK